MKIEERKRAVELRGKGLTYPEIGKILGVGRGTLSYWLRSISYTPCQETLNRRRESSIRNGLKLRQRKIERVAKIKEEAKREINALSYEALKLLGTMAYWCEGSKSNDSLVKFTNSEETLIELMMKWFRLVKKVPEGKFRIHVRVHPDEDVDKIRRHWSKVTSVPLSQFYKTTIKVSESGGLRPNKLPYGIVSIAICDTNLFCHIKGWTEGLLKGVEKFSKE